MMKWTASIGTAIAVAGVAAVAACSGGSGAPISRAPADDLPERGPEPAGSEESGAACPPCNATFTCAGNDAGTMALTLVTGDGTCNVIGLQETVALLCGGDLEIGGAHAGSWERLPGTGFRLCVPSEGLSACTDCVPSSPSPPSPSASAPPLTAR